MKYPDRKQWDIKISTSQSLRRRLTPALGLMKDQLALFLKSLTPFLGMPVHGYR